MTLNMSQGQESAVVSQRDWLSLQNFGWKRVRGKEYMDDLSHLWYFHVVRSYAYAADPHLNALFERFSKTYGHYLRLKAKGKRGFWNFLWSLILSGLLIFVGVVFASLANFYLSPEFGQSVLSTLPFNISLPGADTLKIIAIALLSAGALLFFLYTFLRTLIIIPVKRKNKKKQTIAIMLEARKYITGKNRRSKRASARNTGSR